MAGLVVFLPKAWDVLLNSWIGSRSDRTESRWGPRRPWMLAGGLALPPLFVLVFAGPGAPPALAALWVAIAFLLAATAYGCFQVPYVAQPADITRRPGRAGHPDVVAAVVGRPVATLVAVAQDGDDGVDVPHLADEMTARGWLLQPQPPFDQPDGALPATLHLTVTGATAERVTALLADLSAAARAAAALPPPVPDPELVAAAAGLDPATLTVAEVEGLLELGGVGGGALPGRMAPVHALVAALPRPVAERLLAGMLGRIYRPSPPTGAVSG